MMAEEDHARTITDGIVEQVQNLAGIPYGLGGVTVLTTTP
jgi:hypothetical protein